MTVDLAGIDAAPPAPPVFAKANPASRLPFVGFDPLWGTADLKACRSYPAPSVQFVVYLQGVMSITTTDGETRQFTPGDVQRVEDTAPCKGRVSAAGDSASFTAIAR